MASGGKADHRDAAGIHMPGIRMIQDQLHGLLVIIEGVGPDCLFIQGIAQYKSVVARLQIGKSYGIRFPV